MAGLWGPTGLEPRRSRLTEKMFGFFFLTQIVSELASIALLAILLGTAALTKEDWCL